MLRSLVAAALLSTLAHAGEYTQPFRLSITSPVAQIQPAPPGETVIAVFLIDFEQGYTASSQFENTTAFPSTATPYSSTVRHEIQHNGERTYVVYAGVTPELPALDSFDGTVDFAGTSGCTINTGFSNTFPPISVLTSNNCLGEGCDFSYGTTLTYTPTYTHGYDQSVFLGHYLHPDPTWRSWVRGTLKIVTN